MTAPRNNAALPNPLGVAASLLLGLAACAAPGTEGAGPTGTRGERASVATEDESVSEQLEALLEVLVRLGLPPDARIADLTPGDGTLAFFFAESRPRSVVYAVETELDQLAALRTRLLETPLLNLVLALGSPHRTHLPPSDMDLVLLSSDEPRFRRPGRTLLELASRFGSRGGLLIILRGTSVLPDAPQSEPVGTPHTLLGPLRDSGYSIHGVHALGEDWLCEIWGLEPGA